MKLTLRSIEAENDYRRDIDSGLTNDLATVQSLHEWKHWRLIENEYPYDMVFKTHHMLVPHRNVTSRYGLSTEELTELEDILYYFVQPNYDLFFENTIKRQSVLNLYHVHLAKYYNSRESIKI